MRLSHDDDRRIVRRPLVWVGLNAAGAVDVDAAVARAERDYPGWTVQDWIAS